MSSNFFYLSVLDAAQKVSHNIQRILDMEDTWIVTVHG